MNTNQMSTPGIHWDDTWHRVEVNGRMLTLSPTQYRICRAFLATSNLSTMTGEMLIVTYRTCNELQTETELPHHLLVKHISNVNARIIALGLQLCAFRAGYILTLSSPNALSLGRENKKGAR
jgi:hypothetical protein